jgi:hypothetical protein
MWKRSSRCVLSCLAVAVLASAGFAESPAEQENRRFPELNWTPRSDWLNVRAAGGIGAGVGLRHRRSFRSVG